MKPDFPEMKELRAKIHEYDREIRTQINFVKQMIKAQYEASRDQEASFFGSSRILVGRFRVGFTIPASRT